MISLLKDELKGKRERRMYWLGIRRGKISGGQTTWYVDTKTKMSNEMRTKLILNGAKPWGLGEPGTTGDCATIDTALQWKWNGVSCMIDAFVVCQHDGAQRYNKEQYQILIRQALMPV